MKLLFDQNLSFKLCRRLEELFPDSSQVRLLNLDSASDGAIWDYAARHGFWVVTLDADFAELAATNGPPPKIVWLRCGNQPTSVVESLLRRHAELLDAFAGDLEASILELY